MPLQDEDNPRKQLRNRANTTSFTPFASWRSKSKSQNVQSPEPLPVLPLEALIEALSPPAVPSLGHAKALVAALASHSPLPSSARLKPVFSSICGTQWPAQIQSAGYEVFSAYWEHNEAPALSTSDRIVFFSFFCDSSIPWALELWEPRFKALRALTKWGTDVIGIERDFLDVLKRWIQGAFDGLLLGDTLERRERAERERSIEVFSELLNDVAKRPEVMARVSEKELSKVLLFYAVLVKQSLDVSPKITTPSMRDPLPTSPPPRPKLSHRKNPSSASLAASMAASISAASSSASMTPPPVPHPPIKHPAEVAVGQYLIHLSPELKGLAPDTLETILPVLFRAMAFYASPLARLTILPHGFSKSAPSMEDKIGDILAELHSGPYSASCMRILKYYLCPLEGQANDAAAIQTCLGALRTLRNYIRHGLISRLARAYISNESSMGYSHSGAPGHIDMSAEALTRAWSVPDDGAAGWDAGRLGPVLASAVGKWVQQDIEDASLRAGRENIFEEAAGTLKDIFQELDLRADDDKSSLDEEESSAVGATLEQLARYILTLNNNDGTPLIIPLSQPGDAPTPCLRSLATLLARDHTVSLNPLLSTILLQIADHLTDADTAKLPIVMLEQHDLLPTSPEWLENWENLLQNPTIIGQYRPMSRHALLETLQSVYESVKDMPMYRRPLADLVFDFCQRQTLFPDFGNDESDTVWALLGDEIVLRTVEDVEDDETPKKFIDLLVQVAQFEPDDDDDDEEDAASVGTYDTQASSPQTIFTTGPFSAVSPIISRMQSEFSGSPAAKEKESTLPNTMRTLLSTLANSTSPRSQSAQSHPEPEIIQEDDSMVVESAKPVCYRVVGAVSALVNAFSQFTFTPYVLAESSQHQAALLHSILLNILMDSKSPRAKITVLQFLMRMRADRDHALYYIEGGHDADGHIRTLASLINRVSVNSPMRSGSDDPFSNDTSFSAEGQRTRPRIPQERAGRKSSRGRGGAPSNSIESRSRSRAPPQTPLSIQSPKPREPLWRVPDSVSFVVAKADTPSEVFISYDPAAPENRLVLPTSRYLDALITILERETNWEIISYVLCNLPVQLANKHLFCGPKSRLAISRLLSLVSSGIISNDFAAFVSRWPIGLKAKDAQGLAYHTLTVLISYSSCFDLQQKHLLVEVLRGGLNAQPTTIKCCLHALALAAFELQPSMTKSLSRILEKLSQIMSNADMAVHILGFISIIGSLRPLHANFTDADYKMVFGVALQFLQHHNRNMDVVIPSWALTQHVRILSFYVVYIWFLAVKMVDRQKHVRYIIRQLLLANEGKEKIDEPTEVCFDWLARYTYASADPRPTNSIFNDIIMNGSSSEAALDEKTWVLGTSIVTIRTLKRLGWVEVLSRRPSGFTKFLCRVENVPMVGPGDVDPDMFTRPATLMMSREPMTAGRPLETREQVDALAMDQDIQRQQQRDICSLKNEALPDPPPVPDPITGYVWSGTAPSQRRKEVIVDPAFFALQLSSYPEVGSHARRPMIRNSPALDRFIRTLDRMPVIDTHKVGIMYVAPGQSDEKDILQNTHGSPAYTRFLEGIGRLINLRGQVDVYAGGLDPDEDGEYAYASWDDIGQVLYHTATMMPTSSQDPGCNNKKRHIGNDYVRIIWNDSGKPYRFDTLSTQFQFINIVIEPHSLGAIAAFSNNLHENEYFKVTVQRAEGMPDFAPVGDFKLISAESLPLLVRQLSLLTDWFATTFQHTNRDTEQNEMSTNWHQRLLAIRKFQQSVPTVEDQPIPEGVMGQETMRDFTATY